ncbi:MAG: hypothetical protein QOE01_3215 [Actinomycetota bacterium]|jgi:hypothetical protein|nr:hypothetical protein [Actinomycetota bacterium]
MSRIALTCTACAAEVTVSSRHLMVRVDVGHSESGELLYTCLFCAATVVQQVDAASVAALVSAGVSYLALSEPIVGHPECPPCGPVFTHDDVLDLHTRLARTGWFDEMLTRLT